MIWGSVADWFAAIGTVGTLILALLLLVRDRLRERQKAADSFVTWRSREYYMRAAGSDEKDTVHVINTYNAGDAPIAQAYAQYLNPDNQRWEAFMLGGGHKGIPPLASFVNRTEQIASSQDPLMYVVFRDRYGQRWVRDLENGNYLGPRKQKAVLDADLTFV